MTRLERLAAGLDQPLLVTNVVNVRYLTGFKSSNAALLVEPGRSPRLFTDFRYLTAAKDVPEVELVDAGRSVLRGVAAALGGRVSFEAGAVTVAALELLSASAAELVPSHNIVERLRAVKETDEIAAIRAAAEVTSQAYERLSQQPFVGRSERELAWQIRELFHELGAEGESFPAIVASGPNGALPHAEPGDRVVGEGELVVVDCGAVVDGYCADCTRTFATGPISEELERAYAVCLDSQEQALAATVAGALCREVDSLARGLIDGGEFAGLFGHGLGHGVGLDIHEAPGLRPEAPEDDVLARGNVVTVEPGIYLPERGGVRIEDLVVVTAGAAEVLTTFTKELITVPR